jgi:hypothetical protein
VERVAGLVADPPAEVPTFREMPGFGARTRAWIGFGAEPRICVGAGRGQGVRTARVVRKVCGHPMCDAGRQAGADDHGRPGCWAGCGGGSAAGGHSAALCAVERKSRAAQSTGFRLLQEPARSPSWTSASTRCWRRREARGDCPGVGAKWSSRGREARMLGSSSGRRRTRRRRPCGLFIAAAQAAVDRHLISINSSRRFLGRGSYWVPLSGRNHGISAAAKPGLAQEPSSGSAYCEGRCFARALGTHTQLVLRVRSGAGVLRDLSSSRDAGRWAPGARGGRRAGWCGSVE